MVEERIRRHLGSFLGRAELVIYALLAVLLSATAIGALASAGRGLWEALGHWVTGTETPAVLMVVEILNTVRISIRSHMLLIEPFLVVGIIASIRRILVITLEAAALTKEGRWASEGASSVFRASMFELGLLGLVVLILVYAITLLR